MSLPRCVTFGKFLNLSEPHFPHLSNGIIVSAVTLTCSYTCAHVKCWAQSLAHSDRCTNAGLLFLAWKEMFQNKKDGREGEAGERRPEFWPWPLYSFLRPQFSHP